MRTRVEITASQVRIVAREIVIHICAAVRHGWKLVQRRFTRQCSEHPAEYIVYL
jgi:hypothetical protein